MAVTKDSRWRVIRVGLVLARFGMRLMSSVVELVLIFIALEISASPPTSWRAFAGAPLSVVNRRPYFLLGSFATHFFFMRRSDVRPHGSTSIAVIAMILRLGGIPILAYVGLALIFVGLGSKCAAPFTFGRLTSMKVHPRR